MFPLVRYKTPQTLFFHEVYKSSHKRCSFPCFMYIYIAYTEEDGVDQSAYWICPARRLMLHERKRLQRLLIAHCADQLCNSIDLTGINGLIYCLTNSRSGHLINRWLLRDDQRIKWRTDAKHHLSIPAQWLKLYQLFFFLQLVLNSKLYFCKKISLIKSLTISS